MVYDYSLFLMAIDPCVVLFYFHLPQLARSLLHVSIPKYNNFSDQLHRSFDHHRHRYHMDHELDSLHSFPPLQYNFVVIYPRLISSINGCFCT